MPTFYRCALAEPTNERAQLNLCLQGGSCSLAISAMYVMSPGRCLKLSTRFTPYELSSKSRDVCNHNRSRKRMSTYRTQQSGGSSTQWTSLTIACRSPAPLRTSTRWAAGTRAHVEIQSPDSKGLGTR